MSRESRPVIPIGRRVLVRKDEASKVTSGGIHLPGNTVIPNLTGVILEIGSAVSEDESYRVLEVGQKILYIASAGVPVNFEPDDYRYVVPVESIVAIIGRATARQPKTIGAEA